MQNIYSIELNRLSKRVKDYLWVWAAYVLGVDKMKIYAGVKIIEFAADHIVYEHNIDEMVNEVLYSGTELADGVWNS